MTSSTGFGKINDVLSHLFKPWLALSHQLDGCFK